MGEPVDNQVVLGFIRQAERVDGDSLDLEANRFALVLDGEVEVAEDLLIRERPAEVGTERKADQADGGLTGRGHRGLPDSGVTAGGRS